MCQPNRVSPIRVSPLRVRGLMALLPVLALLGQPGRVAAQTCVGDCDGDGQVLINELLIGVNIALGEQPLSACPVFADEEGEVTIAQLMKGIDSALRSSCEPLPSATATPTPSATALLPTASATPSLTPPAASPTATATPTTPSSTGTATSTATATASPTATHGPAVCGDGFVSLDQGETCDDGNTADGDSCPADCRIATCAGPAQGTMTVEVQFATMPNDLAIGGLTLFLRYPENRVSILGANGDPAVRARVTSPAGFSVTPNDLDYGLRAVLIDPNLTGIGAGTALAVQFDICAGQALPLARDFQCAVEDATALDDQGTPIPATDQVTCSVRVQPPVLPLVCGDGIVNLAGGETCDDGNTADGDGCPSTCHVDACALPGGQTVTASVVFSTTPADLGVSGMTLLVDYPEGAVGISGSSNDAAVQSRVASASFSLTPNDLDYALRAVLIDPTFNGVGAGPALTIQFDVCQGAALPSAGAFTCTVLDAVDADLAPVTDHVECSVIVP